MPRSHSAGSANRFVDNLTAFGQQCAGDDLIRQIEQQIAERGWAEGWITPQRAARKTGKRVGVIGSGPAGLTEPLQIALAGLVILANTIVYSFVVWRKKRAAKQDDPA